MESTMNVLYRMQTLQLKLIESALINQTCATDLLTVLDNIDGADAESVRDIIDSLQAEKEKLRVLSIDVARGY